MCVCVCVCVCDSPQLRYTVLEGEGVGTREHRNCVFKVEFFPLGQIAGEEVKHT